MPGRSAPGGDEAAGKSHRSTYVLELTVDPSPRVGREAAYMRVLLADDHPKVRWALRAFIQEDPEFTVIGEASDADSLLSEALALRPDLVLLEWELAGLPVGQMLPALLALDLKMRVIVLSWQPGLKQIALDAGADDFVSKANGPETLLAALRFLTKNQAR